MKITFDLDNSCGLCKRGFAKLAKLQAKNTNACGSRDLKTGKAVGKIQLMPDYNSMGYLTHWHIR